LSQITDHLERKETLPTKRRQANANVWSGRSGSTILCL